MATSTSAPPSCSSRSPASPCSATARSKASPSATAWTSKQAKQDEHPNQHLIDRHNSLIAPLLKNRQLFAESANFTMYDFDTGHGVDENVFAYSNRSGWGEQRGLILYNNAYSSTDGTLRTSVPFVDKGANTLRQRSLFRRPRLPRHPRASPRLARHRHQPRIPPPHHRHPRPRPHLPPPRLPACRPPQLAPPPIHRRPALGFALRLPQRPGRSLGRRRHAQRSASAPSTKPSSKSSPPPTLPKPPA